MEIYSPNSKSTSSFFIPTAKKSPTDAINGKEGVFRGKNSDIPPLLDYSFLLSVSSMILTPPLAKGLFLSQNYLGCISPKETLVPKFSNGFFKPDMFMESRQEKKKRGRPRKVAPNQSFSDSSSNIGSIPVKIRFSPKGV